MNIQHIVAYVTGGANGIGKACAEKIFQQGGKVVVADISCNGAKVVENMGDKAIFTCTDVSSIARKTFLLTITLIAIAIVEQR